MPFFRWLIPVLFVIAGVFFAAFMLTGNPRYKLLGIRVLVGALLAAFGFFAVLIAINLSQ
jgi:hypothetical protein